MTTDTFALIVILLLLGPWVVFSAALLIYIVLKVFR